MDGSKKSQKSSPLDALTKKGKAALDKLYKLGCDRFTLDGLLIFLSRQEPIVFKTDLKLSLRRLDSWDTALDGLSLDDLKDIAEKAEQLKKDIRRLKKTPFVRQLVDDQILPEGDLLGGTAFFTAYGRDDPRFWGLLNLPLLAKQIGPRIKPDYTRLLLSLFEHIEQATGKPRYELVAETLNDLLPQHPNNPPTVEGLRSWRMRELKRMRRKRTRRKV